MKLLVPFLLLFALGLIEVDSVDLNKLLFPLGFDAEENLGRHKRSPSSK